MSLRSTLLTGLIPVCFLATALPAQQPARSPGMRPPAGPGRIGGKVIAESGRPLGTVMVTIRGVTDSAFVTGFLTTSDGRFQVSDLPLGAYRLYINHVGYRPISLDTLTLSPTTPAFDAGAVKLNVMPVALPELQVKAGASAVVLEADRTVYNTKDLPAAAGTVLDLLRAVPELEIDINGAITIRGNQSVAIHVNGRPAPLRGDQLANYLSQMPGNRIGKVEVIPNPSAKYDPEGVGGIVNLVLREDPGGGLSTNASTRGNRGVSGRLNAPYGRLVMFASGSINSTDSEGDYYDLRKNLVAQPITMIEQNSQRSYTNTFYNLDLTAELRVGEQSTIWGIAGLYNTRDRQDIWSAYGIHDESETLIERYDRQLRGRGNNNTYDVMLGFKHVMEPQRHEFAIDLRRTAGANDHDSDWTRDFLTSAGQSVDWPTEITHYDIDSDNDNLSLQADYVRPLSTGGRFEIGYRGWRRAEGNDNQIQGNTSTFGQPASARTGYDHEETFHSVYSTVTRTRGRAVVQLGARAERAVTNFALPVTKEDFDNSYSSVFPSANVSYDLGSGRRLRLSYTKRIGRPSAALLNPSVPNDDQFNLYFGNPNLRPTYTHQVNLDLSWVGRLGLLQLAPNYRKTADNWDQIRLVDSYGTSTLIWTNAASLDVWGATLTGSLRNTRGLSGSATASVYRQMRDVSNLSMVYSRSSWLGSANVNLMYQVTRSLLASTSVRYMPAYSLIQGRASGWLNSQVGFRQQLWGGKGSINLFANDPFDLFRFTFETEDSTHSQRSRTTVKQRMATVSFSYNFGMSREQNSRRQTDEPAAPATIIR
jgi:outer membrane receptor protein involved in Fe transport